MAEQGPKMSRLCRTITCEGEKLEIFIYEDGAGKWLLEVVNEESTSTAWTEPFDTEQEALDEALLTIKENGREHFKMEGPNRVH